MPDFSDAVTRPVGIGNLQVVRQELVGYRPATSPTSRTSSRESLCAAAPGVRRSARLILTEETITTHAEERDHQSTDRNELSSETQKESGRQSSTSGERDDASDYGRLVENSKTNFAQTVVSNPSRA